MGVIGWVQHSPTNDSNQCENIQKSPFLNLRGPRHSKVRVSDYGQGPGERLDSRRGYKTSHGDNDDADYGCSGDFGPTQIK